MTIRVKGISFRYDKAVVLKNINLAVGDGEIVSLVGPNGVGKSTLLKCMNRILKITNGAVWVDGENARRFSMKKMAQCFGYVPQTTLHTFPATVFDTVLLGRRPYVGWAVGSLNRDIVYKILILMNLDHLALRQFNQLSGGEQQRALIARALAQEPRALLLDEPTSNLDLKHQLEVLQQLVSIVKKRRISVVMAIHDLNLAAQFSDRIIFLKHGEVFKGGTPGEVLTSENIRMVYEVEAKVNNDFERPHIMPMSISAN